MDEFIILSQQDLRAAMRFGDYVEAVADGFRLLAEGRCASPVPTQIDVAHGAFHLKPASLPRGPGYVAVKINGNFPDNRARNGLPTIQGAVLLADASNGRPLALLDSAEITLQRTGAATAVAARHLARADARTCSMSVASSHGTSIPRPRAPSPRAWPPPRPVLSSSRSRSCARRRASAMPS